MKPLKIINWPFDPGIQAVIYKGCLGVNDKLTGEAREAALEWGANHSEEKLDVLFTD